MATSDATDGAEQRLIGAFLASTGIVVMAVPLGARFVELRITTVLERAVRPSRSAGVTCRP